MKKWFRKTLVLLCTTLMLAIAGVALAGCSGCKDKCSHKWGKGTVTLEATCTTRGEMTYKCKKCSKTKTESISPSHKFTDLVTAATCTEDGYTTHTCENCGEIRVDTVVDATGHDYEVETTQATCEEDGYNIYTCACGDEYQEVVARATGHNTKNATWTFLADEQIEGSCVWQRTEAAKCATCEETVHKVYEVEKHNYQVTLEEATCTQEGEKTFTCDCGDSYTETQAINANAHAWLVDGTANGVTTYVCDHDPAHTKREVSLTGGDTATLPTEAKSADVELKMDNATMQMDETLLGKLTGDVELTAGKFDQTDSTVSDAVDKMSNENKERLGNAQIFNFGLTNNGAPVNFDGGKMTVSVPYELQYGEDPDCIGIWYIDEDGDVKMYEATYANGFATFEADHFSFYTVVRLTPEERCAKYGHDWMTTVYPATCTEDGYTLKVCRKCRESSRTDFTDAIGHDYVSAVTAPTCSAFGFTTYTCENCEDVYVSNRVDALKHSYKDTVVDPTCTQDGYTSHVCEHCHKTNIDAFVDKLGHDYKDGACSVCGAKDPNAIAGTHNFYVNLVGGGAQADQLYFEIEDVEIEADIPAFMMEMGAERMDTTITIENGKFAVAFDSLGMPEAKGEIAVKMVSVYTLEDKSTRTETMTGTFKFAMKDGNLYAYSSDTVDGILDEDYVCEILSGEEMEEAMGSMNAMLSSLLPIMDENGKVILEKLLTAGGSPMEAALKKVFEYMYTKTETADGYSFAFNFDTISDVYEVLTTKTIGQAFDLVCGEGKFDSTVTWLKGSIDKTIGALITEFTVEALKSGLDMADVYALADAILVVMMPAEQGGTQMTVQTLLAQYNTLTVKSFLDQLMGENGPMTTAEYQAMIDGYAAEIKNMPVMELVMMLGNIMQGGGEMVGPAPNPRPEQGEQHVKPMEDEMPVDPIAAMLENVLAAFEETVVGFTTDKFGHIQTLDFKLDIENFVFDLAPIFAEMMFIDESSGAEEMPDFNVYVTAEGTAQAVVGKTYATEYTDMIAKIENAKKAITFTDGQELNVKDGSLHVKVIDGVTYVTEAFGLEHVWLDKDRLDYVPDVVDGEQCLKVLMSYGYETYAFSDVYGFTFSKNCTGWTEYYINGGNKLYQTYYYVWVKEENGGEVLKAEVAWEQTLAQDKWSSNDLLLYYNETSKAYSTYEPHSWQLIETKEPECEVEGYRLYRCRVCSAKEKEFIWKGHSTEERYELKTGSTSCEDGAWAIAVCRDCEKEVNRAEINWHGTNKHMEPISGAECQNLALRYRQCPCGEELSLGYYEWVFVNNNGYTEERYKEWKDVDGDCNFDCLENDWWWDYDLNGTTVDYYEVWVYTCSVTACKFTYVKEYWWTVTDCKRTDTYKYTLGANWNGDELVTTGATVKTLQNTYGYHDEVTTNIGADPVLGLENVYEERCRDCDTLLHKWGETIDQYGRTLRWWNYDQEYGYITEIDAECHYVNYNLNPDGSKGKQMDSGVDHSSSWYTWHYLDSSCTQYNLEYRHCEACDRYEYRQFGPAWGHSFGNYNDETGMYTCYRCGMESPNNANGMFYLEDMSDKYGMFAVGFWNSGSVFDFHLVVNHGEDGQGIVLNDVDYEFFWYKTGEHSVSVRCGSVVIDKDSLQAAFDALEAYGVEIESFSVVFEWADPASGNYDEETGYFEGSFIEEAVTWEIGA